MSEPFTGTLAERIASGVVGIPELAALAREAGGALAILHARGLGHGDITPATIRFAPQGIQLVGGRGNADAAADAIALGRIIESCLAGRAAPPELATRMRRLLAGILDDETDATLGAGSAPTTAASMPAIRPAPSGTYTVEGEIARGGLGRILRARDDRLRRLIAIKELIPGRGASRARLLREAIITGRLEHPGIVPVYDAGTWPSGEPFYAMKLVSGRTLRDRIAEATTLAERLALLPRALAVADAIAYAHSRGVIHRDIKPANVIIGEFGETMVVDWGVAKELGTSDDAAATDGSAPSDPEHTVYGTILGTPQYMAPEQAAGQPVDERADVFALGALLYELLAGVPPRQGGTRLGDVVPLEERQPGLPVDLLAIVHKAMAQEPSARYENAGEFAEDLKRYTTGQLVGAHRYRARDVVRRWFARRRALVTVSAAALGVLVIVGIVSVSRIVSARRVAEERAASLVLAQADALRARDPTAALAWLEHYPASAPGWARARDIIADASARGVAHHVLLASRGAETVAIAPDGKTVAARADNEGTIQLWSLPALREQTIAAHGTSITALRFSRGGGLLASAADDGMVRVWDIRGPTAHQIAELHLDHFAQGIAFVPGERRLALSRDDGQVQLWDLSQPAAVTLGRHRSGSATDVAIAPDGRLIATCGLDQTVRIWDMNGSAVRTFEGPRSFTSVAWSPDGRAIAATDENAVHEWTLESGAHRVLEKRYEATLQATFVALGAIAFGDRQGEVHVWWPANGDVQTLFGHSGPILSVDAAAGLLVSGSRDRTVRVWPVPAQRHLARLPVPASGYTHFSRDGRWIASGDILGGVDLLDVATGQFRRLTGHDGPVSGIDFSPDVKQVLSNDKHSVRLWDLASGTWHPVAEYPFGWHPAVFTQGRNLLFFKDQEATLLDPSARPRCTFPFGWLLYDHHNTHLAITQDRRVSIVSVPDCEIREVYRSPTDIVHFGIAHDASSLTVSGNDSVLALHDVASGRTQLLRGHQAPIAALVYSYDGRILASSDTDGIVKLWDVASAAEIRVLNGHTGEVRQLRFSQDSRRLASVDASGTIRVWTVPAGDVTIYHGHEKGVRDLVFSPDGKLLASTGFDGTIRLWPGDPNASTLTEPAALAASLRTLTTAEMRSDGKLATPTAEDR